MATESQIALADLMARRFLYLPKDTIMDAILRIPLYEEKEADRYFRNYWIASKALNDANDLMNDSEK